LTATDDEDSESEEDVKSWTYYSGDVPSKAEKKEARPAISDEEVKTTFWIDEDEDDLPDISDWS